MDTVLRLGVDASGAEQGARRVVRSLEDIRKAANRAVDHFEKVKKEFRGLSAAANALKSAGQKLTAFLTLPLAALAAASLKAAADIDTLKRSLVAVLGSAEAAEAQFKRLQDVARLPGLGLQEAVRGFVQLKAAGFGVQLAERSLRAFGNAIATVGGGREQLDSVIRQLSQMASKGKLAGEELVVIAENVPQIRRALFDAFGTTDSKALNKLGVERIIEGMVEQLEKLPQATGGAKNAWENFRDTLFVSLGKLGDHYLPVATRWLDRLTGAVEDAATWFGNLSPRARAFATGLAVVAAGIGPVLWGLGQMASALLAIRTASIAAQASMGWVGAISLAIGAVGYAFWKTGEQAREAARKSRVAAEEFRAALGIMDDATFNATHAQNIATRAQLVGQIRAARANIGQQIAARPGQGYLEKVESAKAIRHNQAALKELLRLEDVYARRVAQGSEELQRRNAEALRTGTGNDFVPPGVDDTADKAAGALERLNGAIRERNALASLGVTSFTLLPDGLEEALQTVLKLEDGVSDFHRALRDVQKAGKPVPRGAEAALASMRAEVNIARTELVLLADAFARFGKQDFAKKVTVRTDLQGSARRPAQEVLGLGGRPVESVDALRNGNEEFNRQQEATWRAREAAKKGGSRLGDLGHAIGGRTGAKIGDGLAGVFGSLKNAVTGVLGAFGPLSVVAGALRQALEPVMPLIDMVVKIFANALAPVLKAFYPMLKLSAIALTYFGEIVFKVAGAFTYAIGWLIRAIGKAVDALLPGRQDGLTKIGQGIIDIGKGFFEGAEALAKGREELKNLEYGARAAARAVADIPKAINLALYRSRVTGGGGGGGGGGGNTGGGGTIQPPEKPSYGGGGGSISVRIDKVVNEAGDTPEDFARKVAKGAQILASQGVTLYMPGLRTA